MYDIRPKIRVALDELYNNRFIILPDTCCFFPPLAAGNDAYGPFYERYESRRDGEGRSEISHPGECSRLISEMLESSDTYFELFRRFLGRENVYLVPQIYGEVARNLEAMEKIEADWLGNKQKNTSPLLRENLRRLIRYQTSYSRRMKEATESMIREGRIIAENDACWKRAEDIYRFLSFGSAESRIGPDDKADGVLVSVAVAMALETRKRIGIFSVDLDTKELLEGLLRSDTLDDKSKTVLALDRSSVGIYYIGAKKYDLVILTDTARFARGDIEIKRRGDKRTTSRRLRTMRQEPE